MNSRYEKCRNMTRRSKGFIDVNSSLPADGVLVDVWFDVYASPLSMGMADRWCEPDCWRNKGKWEHTFRGEVAELNSNYITHWRPIK